MVKFDIVQSWLDNVAYSHSDSINTRDQYPRRLALFCEFVEKSPEQIVADYRGMNEREVRRRYAQYIKALIVDMRKKKLASTTISGVVTAIKSFFKYNDLPLAFVPLGKNRVKYHNRDITKAEIVQILKVSNARDRAFFCMMSQSGLGPERLSLLKRKHIEPEFTQGIIPCKIDVPEEIAKGEYGAYFTFMPEETIKYLKAYFITRRTMTPGDWLFTNLGTTEQINTKSMSGIFSRIIKKMSEKGLIEIEQRAYGKPRSVRLYNLRKFFRKMAGHAGVEYVNFWMGHKANYKAPHIPASDEHYFSREDVEFQRRLYEQKAMPDLRLESATPTEREAEIIDLRKKNEYLMGQIERLQPIIDSLDRFENPNELLMLLEGKTSNVKLRVKEGGSIEIDTTDYIGQPTNFPEDQNLSPLIKKSNIKHQVTVTK